MPGVQVLDDRVDGVKEIVASEAPGITVEGPFDTTADPASNFSAWEALMQRYPDALAYIGVCDPDLPNLIKLKQRDPEADYAIVGANFVPETIQGLKNGIGTASVWQSPFMQGYVPIRAVLEQLVNGEEVRAAGICGSDVHGYRGDNDRRAPRGGDGARGRRRGRRGR